MKRVVVLLTVALAMVVSGVALAKVRLPLGI